MEAKDLQCRERERGKKRKRVGYKWGEGGKSSEKVLCEEKTLKNPKNTIELILCWPFHGGSVLTFSSSHLANFP